MAQITCSRCRRHHVMLAWGADQLYTLEEIRELLRVGGWGLSQWKALCPTCVQDDRRNREILLRAKQTMEKEETNAKVDPGGGTGTGGSGPGHIR